MSLPSFPDKSNVPSREEVINQIISSIAMEELGLSHIINAEGEKLQYALGTIPGQTVMEDPLTMEELLKLNDSIHKTLDSTMMNQFFLKEKLYGALSAAVMKGATGATGAMTTILDSYDTIDQLRKDHPIGKPGDAYIVGRELYVWNAELNDWKSAGDLTGPSGAQGPTGPIGTILDSFKDLAELKQKHPSGSVGDMYLAGGELYMWDNTGKTWKPLGSMIGPTGPTGPATIEVDSVVELDPGRPPTVENVGPDNQHAELKFGIPRGTTGPEGKSAYDVAVANGFKGTEAQWLDSLKASSVTIIPFASQQAPYVGADAIGKPINVALLGFGYLGVNTGVTEDANVAIALDASQTSFSLGLDANKNRQLTFSMPFKMKLNSIYLTTGNWEKFSISIPAGTEVFPYVQIFTAPAGSNTFLALEGAAAKPTEGLHPESAQASTMLKAEVSGLDIELEAGTRVAICGMMEIKGDSALRRYYLYFTGGVGFSY